jgi:ubiquinone/menaquinone biosynthesis C-methylase UbiE
MDSFTNNINEVKAAEAFSKQSKLFDAIYGADDIILYKRRRVREHVLRYLQPNNSILELNCGTGEDAIFFAQHGHNVHATDISNGMLKKLIIKTQKNNYIEKISFEQCSFTDLDSLKNKGPFDHIFSNFGGLNCTGELDKTLQSFSPLLKPGGYVTLVIISKFCLWETLLLFKGKFKTAFRRFFSNRGKKANVEGTQFKCWYYSSSYIKKQLKNDFEVLSIEGLCTLVPPSYIENFSKKYPQLFYFLKNKENKWAAKWPWKHIGDYYIISLKKK